MSKRKWTLPAAFLLLAGVLFFALSAFVKKGAFSGDFFSGEEKRIKIRMEGDRIRADSAESLLIEGSRLTIRAGGTYQLTGQLDDGQIIVEAGEEDQVELVFKNVQIHCQDLPPLWVRTCDRVKIKLAAGSENSLSDGPAYSKVPDGVKQPNACIYSRRDLTIKGQGSLEVKGNHRNGIFCADDILVNGGKLTVAAVHNGVRCNGTFAMEAGAWQIQAGRDGIYDKDLVELSGGDMSIRSKRYGIFAFLGTRKSDEFTLNIEGARSPLAGHKEE